MNVDGYGSMMSYSETSSTVTSDGNEFVREPSEMVLEHNLNLNSPAYFFHDGGLSGSSHASSVDVADKSVTLEVSDILEQNAEELQNEEIDANVIIPKGKEGSCIANPIILLLCTLYARLQICDVKNPASETSPRNNRKT